MRNLILIIIIFFSSHIYSQNQTVEDDFEGNGTITNWFGDNCNIDTNQTNLYTDSNNNSATVYGYPEAGNSNSNSYISGTGDPTSGVDKLAAITIEADVIWMGSHHVRQRSGVHLNL